MDGRFGAGRLCDRLPSDCRRGGIADDPSPSPTEVARIGANELSHLPPPTLTTPASLGGIATWSVDMTANLTVVGRNASGAAQAALVFVVGKNNSITTVGCGRSSLSMSCSDVSNAIRKDLGATTASAPSSRSATSLHILTDGDPTTGPSAKCMNDVGQLAGDSPFGSSGLPESMGPPTAVVCNQATEDELVDCVAYWNGGEEQIQLPLGSGTLSSTIYDNCCRGLDKPGKAGQRQLIVGTTNLICNYDNRPSPYYTGM
jgi:hypothetical protein